MQRFPNSPPQIQNHCRKYPIPSTHPQHALSAHPLLSTSLPQHVLHHALKHASRDGLLASMLVRQWRQKRVLMRLEAAFPNVFVAEGAQHPPKRPPRSTNPCRHAQRTHVATLNEPMPPRSTSPCRHAAAGGPFSKVMVDSRGVTFIKNELFLLYSQVIIKECVYGYRSSVEIGRAHV